MSVPELEPVLKSIPEIIKQASQSQLGILALLIIVLFGLAFYFFRKAPIQWRVVIFFAFFAGVVAYCVEIMRVSGKPQAAHYVGRVLDKLTHEPIHRATIVVSLGQQPTPPYYTDSLGGFSFWLTRTNPSEDAGVHIQHTDYQDFDRIVSSDVSSQLGDIPLVPVSTTATTQPAGNSGNGTPAPPSATAATVDGGTTPRSPAGAMARERPTAAAVRVGELHPIVRAPSSVAMMASTAAPQPKVVEVSSGPKVSGKGKAWSEWYQVIVGLAPPGFTIEKDEFWLTGDRSCGSWAECKATKKDDTEVIWEFRLQGHDEWGAPPQAHSEGHLRVTYKPN